MTRHVGYEWGLGWPSDAPAIFWIRFAILRGMVGFTDSGGETPPESIRLG